MACKRASVQAVVVVGLVGKKEQEREGYYDERGDGRGHPEASEE